MSLIKRIKGSLNYRVQKRKQESTEKKYQTLLNATDKNLNIFGSPIVIKEPQNITIGNDCRFNEHVFIHGGGGVTLADNVTLSAYSKVISWTYDTTDWASNYIKKDHVGNPIFLGEGTWVGAGATILPGVELKGKGIIVAAGSVVTKSFEGDFLLIGGSPARVLKRYTTN